MNVGKTLFAQVMEFVPWTSFSRIVERYAGNAGVRRMNCAEQFRVMAFAQLTWRESLRDIEVTLGANSSKLYAIGLRHTIHRSTLADANDSRDWRIWSDLAALLIRRARKLYQNEEWGLDLSNTVYALDATTIDLCLSLFDWAPFRKTKAAVKMHTLLDLRGAILAFIHISDGKMHDVRVLDLLCQQGLIEAGAFYIMDKAYVDFARLYRLHTARAYFVTRSKSNLQTELVRNKGVNTITGLVSDRQVRLTGAVSRKRYPDVLRCVVYFDAETGKTFEFLTNNLSLPALTICALYKQRWQVELFFKWIKQHLRIKKFLGTSENAVKTQIWCAVSTYVLIAIVKKELQLNASLYTLLQILSISVFEKTQISSALQTNPAPPNAPHDATQLNLFGF